MSIIETTKRNLLYYPPYLVAFSLPIKPLKVKIQSGNGPIETKYLSKLELYNGDYSLKLIADQDHGMPFGKDRLLLAHLFSVAAKTGSKYIHYESIKQLLKDLNLSYSKPNRDWLSGAITRISNCWLQYNYYTSVQCETKNSYILSRVAGPLDPKRMKKEAAKKSRLSKAERKKYLPDTRKFNDCHFELSDDLFNNLMEAAIPFDVRVINELGDNYGAIDLYFFWSWRNYRGFLKKEGLIPIPLSGLQAHMMGAKDPYKFSQQMKERLQQVKDAINTVYGDTDSFKARLTSNQFFITPTVPLIEPVKKIPEIEPPKEPQSDVEKAKFLSIRKLLMPGVNR